jgi:hypothetical protein
MQSLGAAGSEKDFTKASKREFRGGLLNARKEHLFYSY